MLESFHHALVRYFLTGLLNRELRLSAIAETQTRRSSLPRQRRCWTALPLPNTQAVDMPSVAYWLSARKARSTDKDRTLPWIMAALRFF